MVNFSVKKYFKKFFQNDKEVEKLSTGVQILLISSISFIALCAVLGSAPNLKKPPDVNRRQKIDI